MNFNTRYEKKFFIHKDEKKHLIKLIKRYLDLEGNSYDKEYTEVESIYFDSPELYCYQGHFTLQDRFKLRVRNYAPDGKNLDYSFLELKCKNGPLTDKQRVQYASQLTKKTIGALNNHFVSNPNDLDIFNFYIETYNLSPIVQIKYDRNSYENQNIRLTIDSNLKTKILKPIPEEVKTKLKAAPYFIYAELLNKFFDSSEFLVVEIKDPYPEVDHFPDPVKEFLKHKQQNFSKYCYSLTKEFIK